MTALVVLSVSTAQNYRCRKTGFDPVSCLGCLLVARARCLHLHKTRAVSSRAGLAVAVRTTKLPAFRSSPATRSST